MARTFSSEQAVEYRRRIQHELARNPAWHVVTREGAWICPYCGGGAAVAERPERERIEGILKHFKACKSWKRFDGTPMSALEVDKRREFLELRERMRADKRFNLTDREQRWYCPACGRRQNFTLPKGKKPALRDLAPIVTHLRKCEAHASEDTPLLTLRQLHVAVRLCSDPRFRCYGPDGHWYCPYTLRKTEITLDRSRVVTRTQIAATDRHLEEALAYEAGAKPARVELVRDAVRREVRRQRILAALRVALETDPVWRVTGRRYWVCPYCRKEIRNVTLSDPFLVREAAPYQITQHLSDDCPAYRRGVEPARVAADLVPGEAAHEPHPERTPQAPAYAAAAAALDAALAGGRESEDSYTEVLERSAATEEELRQAREVAQHQDEVLERARRVQLGMLPEAPTIAGYDFQVVYDPCDQIGGDFYDFFQVSEHEIGIAVGDVAGHGIDAALVMAAAKKSIKIHAQGMSSPRDAMLIVNDDLVPDLPQALFLTLFYGVLDLTTRTLRFVRAGHNPLLVFNPSRQPRYTQLEPGGMILGMARSSMFGKTLVEETLPLLPGDLLFQYTDGLTELMNGANEEYGFKRLETQMRVHGAVSPAAFLQRLQEDMRRFQEGTPAGDDITLLAIKVL